MISGLDKSFKWKNDKWFKDFKLFMFDIDKFKSI